MKIVTIVGARPQFVKAAVVSREILNSKHDDLEEVIIHTGQHFDKNMSEVFFEALNIPVPKYNLHINGVSHGKMTGMMLEKIEKILMDETPDWVLLYGDTNSTLAGALSAAKLHIPVAHIEAGLRSFNKKMPEEINRILTDHVSDILFCPTKTAITNLSTEGITSKKAKVLNVGDVMYDAALFYAKKGTKTKMPENYVLATLHRAENTDSEHNLTEIIAALNKINLESPVILPLHPRTKKFISHYGLKIDFRTIEPVDYLEMVSLIKGSSLIMTDSGGLQKEAFFFSKPCITLRTETEWVELIERGANVLAGSDSSKIYNAYRLMLEKEIDFSTPLYGDGNAAGKILTALIEYPNI